MRILDKSVKSSARIVTVAAASALVLAVAGCSNDDTTTSGSVTPAAVTPAEASAASVETSASEAPTPAKACAKATTPTTELDSKGPSEPRIALPQPAGWERQTSLDSQLVRGAIASRSLTADQFAPNAIVTVETTGGDVDAMFKAQEKGLTSVGGGKVLQKREGEQCGFRTMTFTFTAPPQGAIPSREGQARIIAVPSNGRLIAIAVTVQSTRPDNPEYKAAAKTILDELQVNAA